MKTYDTPNLKLAEVLVRGGVPQAHLVRALGATAAPKTTVRVPVEMEYAIISDPYFLELWRRYPPQEPRWGGSAPGDDDETI